MSFSKPLFSHSTIFEIKSTFKEYPAMLEVISTHLTSIESLDDANLDLTFQNLRFWLINVTPHPDLVGKKNRNKFEKRIDNILSSLRKALTSTK